MELHWRLRCLPTNQQGGLRRTGTPHRCGEHLFHRAKITVNLTCAFVLARYRHHSGSLTKAVFLSARNDAVANVAIIGAGLLTAATLSVRPDLIVGLGIAAINADAAREVWAAARRERLASQA